MRPAVSPLKQGRAGDIPGLSRIGRDTFTEKFGHLYTPENLKSFLDESHSEEWYADALSQPDTGIWVATGEGGELAAYGVAGPNTLPAEGAPARAGEIKRIYVRPAYQGHGLGKRMMALMMAWLTARGHGPLYVGVYSDNLGAQRFYGRLGFEKVGEYIFPVGTHEDREFIMRRTARADDVRVSPLAAPEQQAVLPLISAAFGGDDEAVLVVALRADGDMLFEAVAKRGDELLGHIALSHLTIDFAGEVVDAAALAPVAVSPSGQGEGTGALLCEAALDWWRRTGNGVAVVLGHPDYYPRFGFSAEDARVHLTSPFEGVGDAFMLADPKGRLAGKAGGRLRYAPAFNVS